MIYYDFVSEKYIYYSNLDIDNIIEKSYYIVDSKKITDDNNVVFYKDNEKSKYICVYKTGEINDFIIFIYNLNDNLFEEERINYLINLNVYEKNKDFDYSVILKDVLSHLGIILK